MDRDHLLQIVQPMLVAFRHEITKMRSDGATQAEIAQMLDELDEAYSQMMPKADWSWQFFGKQPGNQASHDYAPNPFGVLEVIEI